MKSIRLNQQVQHDWNTPNPSEPSRLKVSDAQSCCRIKGMQQTNLAISQSDCITCTQQLGNKAIWCIPMLIVLLRKSYKNQYFAWQCGILSYISGPCAAVLELQEDITHSEVQDSVMCSAGRTFFCFCDLLSTVSVAALSHYQMLSMEDAMQRRI